MKIKGVILDVDGVLTDGKKYYLEDKVIKVFSVKDGKGIDLAQKSGIKFAIITADKWPEILYRAKQLNITDVHFDCHDKIKAAQKFCDKYNFTFNDLCFIGDDVNDIPLLNKVGLAATPKDAVDEVILTILNNQGMISTHNGGNGAVRNITDSIRKYINKDLV